MKTSFSWIIGAAALSLAVSVSQAADPTADATKSATPGTKSSSSSSGAVAKINLNTADAATLTRLPGITEETAKAIIAARPFKSVEDVARVEGVGDTKALILKEQLTVDSTDSSSPASTPTGRTDSSSTKKSESGTKSDATKSPSSSTSPSTKSDK